MSRAGNLTSAAYATAYVRFDRNRQFQFRGASVRNILQFAENFPKGRCKTVVLDFKTDRKPNVNSAEDRQRIQNYHRQLEVYAHIVEEKFGKKVSKLHLYYTRAENESPYVSWDYSTVSVQKTLRSFDETVGKIESYKFSNKGVKMCKATCDNCDLRYFCHFK